MKIPEHSGITGEGAVGGSGGLHTAFGCGGEEEVGWGEDSHVAWPAPALLSQERQWCEGWNFRSHIEQVWEGSGQRQKGLGEDESLKDTSESEDRGGCAFRMGRVGGLWCWPNSSLGFCFLSEGIFNPVFLKYSPPLAGMGATAVHHQAGGVVCAHTGTLLGPKVGKSVIGKHRGT